MTPDRFWQLIESVDTKTLNKGEGFDSDAIQPLIEALKPLSKSELEEFEDFLAKALYALDGKVYARNAGLSGRSSDGFLYIRCFVVASGRKYYERVINDPKKMPNSFAQWCEGLLYVAKMAWEATHNSEWVYISKLSYETGSNKEQWK